jgi:DRG Family Regulatory Proteins, Tma46
MVFLLPCYYCLLFSFPSQRQAVLVKGGGTEVTLDRLLTFIEELKVRREQEANEEKNKNKSKKAAKQDKGATLARKLMSGRALFEFKPELLEDDADATTELKAQIVGFLVCMLSVSVSACR